MIFGWSQSCPVSVLTGLSLGCCLFWFVSVLAGISLNKSQFWSVFVLAGPSLGLSQSLPDKSHSQSVSVLVGLSLGWSQSPQVSVSVSLVSTSLDDSWLVLDLAGQV